MESTSANAPTRYSTVAIVLHWAIAALLLFEVGLGLNMEGAKGAARFTVFQLHKSVGITILLLVALRIVWRFMRHPPPTGATGWERVLAHIVHAAFYAILFALPLSGWLIVSASKLAVPTLLYGIVPWPHLPGFATMAAGAKETWRAAGDFVHLNLVNLLYLLFALHVAGALKHHLIDRDGDIARMVPGTRTGVWADPRLLLIGFVAIAAATLGLTWSSAAARREAVAPPAQVGPVEVVPPAPVAAPVEATATPGVEATATEGKDQAELSSWAVQPGSTLRFRTTFSGDAIAGQFSKFGGEIVFGPQKLAQSQATITVDTGSVSSGDSQRDETLKGDDFFATSANRDAVFRTSRFRKTGTDRYVADGTLRLKGMTARVTLPFTLKIVGDVATMRGSATIDRLAYKVGEGDYASTAEIPAAVVIEVAVTARRK